MRPVVADVTIAEDVMIAEDVAAVPVAVVAVDAVVVAITAVGPRAEHRNKSGSYAVEKTDPRRLPQAGRERISQPLHPKLFYQELAR